MPSRPAAGLALLLVAVLTAPTLCAQSHPDASRPLTVAARSAGASASAAQSLTQAVARVLVAEDRLTVPEASTFECFGCAVSISGTRALVGADAGTGDGEGARSGAAYVFVRDAAGWALEARLGSSAQVDGDGFGLSVSLDGTRALVGALVDGSQTFPQAMAYVFSFDGMAWHEEAGLIVPETRTSGLDLSVSLDGDRALIGYPGDEDPDADGFGAAHVFVRTGTSWSLEATLTDPNRRVGVFFGASVSLSGSRAAVGAPGGFSSSQIPPVYTPGSACVFVRNGTSWSLENRIPDPDYTPSSDGVFGDYVALSGDRVLVSAHGFVYDNTGVDRLRAYVFARTGASWVQEATFERVGFYRTAIALSGSRALVTGVTSGPGLPSRLQAFVYVRRGAGWSEESRLEFPDDADDLVFNNNAALSDDFALVGVGGAAFVFQILPTLVVNDVRDLPDADLGDEACDANTGLDGDQCTLRAALQIALADTTSEPVEVAFDIEGAGPHVIALASALPAITRTVVLDGTTEPDFEASTATSAPRPSVFVSGGGSVERGLVVATDSSVVRGLAFGGFSVAAVDIVAGEAGAGPGPHRVEASWFGIAPSETEALPNGIGIRVGGTRGAVVGGAADSLRNVISGNTRAGVQIVGAEATGTVVRRNWIGVAPGGEAALPNAVGVEAAGVPGLVVDRNTILASQAGVRLTGLDGEPATGARVTGNRLGLLPTNQVPPSGPSAGVGVLVENAEDTVVGGVAATPGAAPGNVIGGWAGGVLVLGTADARPVGTRVVGNLVGLDSTGTAARPNRVGVWVSGRADDTRFGGWLPGERNVISGSTAASGRGAGVAVTSGDGAASAGEPTRTVVAGNFIGTDITGVLDVGNQKWGVYVGPPADGSAAGGVSDVTIGATADMASGAPPERRRNVILGSGEANVFIDRTGAASGAPVRVVGNWIGLDVAGAGGIDQSTAGGATRVGVHVTGTALATVGGAGEDGNVVSGHRIGVWMAADDGVVVGNRIGTDPAGLARRANSHGVAVSGSRVRVGLTADGTAVPNVVSGNILAGASNGGNDGVGIYVASADLVQIVATSSRAASAFAGAAVGRPARGRTVPERDSTDLRAAPAARDNIVAYNLVGLTAAGDAAVVPTPELNRTVAVWVTSGAVGTQVYANILGGTFAGLVVAPPNNVAVTTFPAGTRVAGNRIGLAAAGGDEAFVPNRVFGLYVSGTSDTVIGDGAVAGQGPNRIAGTGTEGSGLPPADVAAGITILHPDDAPDGWPVSGPTLRRNLVYGNEGLAITRDTEHFTVTPNSGDNTDGVAGFDFPQLLQAVADGAALTVVGGSSVPMAVEVYADRPCDASGHGEGRLYLGTVQSADGVFEGTVAAPPFSDWRISVTGTNANGTTSEFSACQPVSAPDEAVARPVGPGETPTVGGPDVTVTVTQNSSRPDAPAAARGASSGTLYLGLHRGRADAGAFAGAAASADGTAVTPNAVQEQRFWSVQASGLAGIVYEACLRYDGLFSLPVPGQLVVVTRAGRGEPWTPHASTLRADGSATALCAAGLTGRGELAIGADSTVNPVGIEDGPAVTDLPTALALAAYPNPARGAATVSVAVPAAGPVRVEAFDALGRRVAVLHDGPLAAGTHALAFDASRLPPGVYVVRATSGDAVATRRITVVR